MKIWSRSLPTNNANLVFFAFAATITSSFVFAGSKRLSSIEWLSISHSMGSDRPCSIASIVISSALYCIGRWQWTDWSQSINIFCSVGLSNSIHYSRTIQWWFDWFEKYISFQTNFIIDKGLAYTLFFFPPRCKFLTSSISTRSCLSKPVPLA